MCKCTPNVRTPFCGKPGCEWPPQKNPPRVESFEERKRIQGQRFKIGDHYVCGCGGEYWLLLKNGDCVCAVCRRAQVRIMVNELAPVTRRAQGKSGEPR